MIFSFFPYKSSYYRIYYDLIIKMKENKHIFYPSPFPHPTPYL